MHHFDKNIMKKTVSACCLIKDLQEDYIKPIVIDDDKVLKTVS